MYRPKTGSNEHGFDINRYPKTRRLLAVSPYAKIGFPAMTQLYPAPAPANHFLADHVSLLLDSYKHRLGRDLLEPRATAELTAQAVFLAPFALVSHDAGTDPVFNYANQTALTLFEMPWEVFTRLPSRLSAEPVHRLERARLLRHVAQFGFIDNYEGIRISKTGKRFVIRDAVVWNVVDQDEKHVGQAALFRSWQMLGQ